MASERAKAKEIARRNDEAQAVYALHCDGCPYKTCVGSNAAVSYQERTARTREEIREGNRGATAEE